MKLFTESGGVHILHMERTTQQMSGLYKVTAVNAAGQAEHAATVNITGVNYLFSFQRVYISVHVCVCISQ